MTTEPPGTVLTPTEARARVRELREQLAVAERALLMAHPGVDDVCADCNGWGGWYNQFDNWTACSCPKGVAAVAALRGEVTP